MSFFYNPQTDDVYFGRAAVSAIALIGVCVTAAMVGLPTYRVYSARMAGRAELANADFSKQVLVQQAIAHNQAAQYDAQAEITRARGVAKANQIIGNSLKDNEAYLRYLFVNNLADTKDQVIYVPTEAQLPILEAGKRPATASNPSH